MRFPSRSAVALLFPVLVLMVGTVGATADAGTETVLFAPVEGVGMSAEVLVQMPMRRHSPATKDTILGSLNLLQANAAGAITILVESVGLTGDTPTADDNDLSALKRARRTR